MYNISFTGGMILLIIMSSSLYFEINEEDKAVKAEPVNPRNRAAGKF